MFNPKTLFLILFLFLLTCLSFTPIEAQTTTATLSATVQDEHGAVVPGANVTIVNAGTGARRQTTTNEDGYFVMPFLPPATYTVTVEREGFTPIEVKDVILNVGDQKALAVQLKVGPVTGAVEVTPDTSLVSTSPAVATTVDRNFVSNLPLNGRSFQSLILLTPGVVGTASSGINPGEFSVNGQRQNANYFTVDGVSANTGVSTSYQSFQFSQQAGGAIPGTTALGTTASLVSIDALEEFKIQTSGYSAEFGRQPGGQVQLVTRSGGNQFHGTAFEYLRNDALDARDWFANANKLPKTPLRQNQFGGTFSGPVILPRFGEGGNPFWSGRNGTFFFFSYEGQRLRIPVLTVAPRVPSLRLRQAAAPAFQPFLNAFPLPTGPEIIVGARNPFAPIDPVTNPPVPSGAAPFATAYSNPSTVDAYSIRGDHTVNSKLVLFGRYGYTPSNNLTRNLNQLSGNVLSARTLTLGGTLSITPKLNNEVRFNYTSNRGQRNFSMDNFGGAVPVTLSQLTSGYSGPGVKQGSFNVYLPGFGFSLGLGDQADNSSRQFNIVDNLSWVKGSHEMKFGIDWRRLNSTFGPTAFQQYLEFYSEASLMNSTVDFGVFAANKEARPIYDNYSAYAQDTWKLSPRLTIDLGLRWEINPAPHDANGLRPVVLTGINPPDVSQAAIAPASAPFYKTFKTAFAPRFGLAYQLNKANGRETVLRGGFGVYYDLGSGMASSLFGRYPFSVQEILPEGQVFPFPSALVQPPPFPPVPAQVTPALRGISFFALDPDLQLPYTLQWNVALQQSLGQQQTVTLSYVASAARKLTTSLYLNSTATPFSSTRPNPNLGSVVYLTNGPASDYKSLQAQYQRRLSRGLQALVNYTWSHATDEVSNEFDVGLLERGNASFDVRHNFSAALTYDLPRMSRSAPMALRGIVNGWSVDSTLYARTGLPLDLVAGTIYRPDGTYFTGRPDVIPDVPFWIKDPSVAGGQRLNPAAFSLPPRDPNPEIPDWYYQPARQGTLGRNTVYLPGIYQLNAAVRRQFNFGERIKLQLKAEVFNVLNHPLFGGYNTFPQNGPRVFGVPSSMLNNTLGGLNSLYQIGGPRSIQLSLRLSF